jgi:hypothetical protein
MTSVDNGYHNLYRREKIFLNDKGVGPCISASVRESPIRMSVKQDRPALSCPANSKRNLD